MLHATSDTWGYGSGLVGRLYGTNNVIENCYVYTDLYGGRSDSFLLFQVGANAEVTIKDCLCNTGDGKEVLFSVREYWEPYTINIENSLFILSPTRNAFTYAYNANTTNSYIYCAGAAAGCTLITADQLADGSIATALQNGRDEEIWVQDSENGTPMLKIFLKDEEEHEVVELTANSPVGTVGMLDGHEAMVVELNGEKLAIATMNVGATTTTGETSRGTLLSYYDAIDPEKTGYADGWYLPTLEQLEALSPLLDWNEWSTKTALKWQVTEDAALYFPAASYNSSWNRYYGNYWSGTQGYRLYFETRSNGIQSKQVDYIGTSDAALASTLSVRLFHALPEDTPTNIVELSENDKPKSGIRYNVMGQRVDENYRGIVIEDGKKVLIK